MTARLVTVGWVIIRGSLMLALGQKGAASEGPTKEIGDREQ